MSPPSSPRSANRRDVTPMRSSSVSAGTPSAGSSGSSSKSNAFSAGTKLRAKSMHGNICWACGARPPHVCHVVVQEDDQAPLWADTGLLNFPITSIANAIPLCPTCHEQFDCHIDPGFIFVPTDLQFFIDYELSDKERRAREAERGSPVQRQVPDADQYKAHQVDTGIISPDATGGQYLPVFLKDYLYLSRFPFSSIQSFLSAPREWHGEPMASLRRCFPILGSARVRMLGEETRLQLETLRNLYFLDEEEPRGNVTRTGSDSEQRKREYDDAESDEPRPSKKQRGLGLEDGRDNYTQESTTFCNVLQREVRAYWSLGPEVTAGDALSQFAPFTTPYA